MTEQKQLFGRFKHNLTIDRAPKYLKWLREKYPNKEPHHLIGSQGKLKLTDYLVIMVTRNEHIDAEDAKITYFFENLHRAIQNLIDYIKYLEEQ